MVPLSSEPFCLSEANSGFFCRWPFSGIAMVPDQAPLTSDAAILASAGTETDAMTATSPARMSRRFIGTPAGKEQGGCHAGFAPKQAEDRRACRFVFRLSSLLSDHVFLVFRIGRDSVFLQE